MAIHPMRINGPWDEGFALDWHVVSATPLGEDVYGNPRFSTTRSVMGELVFQLKYRYNYSKVDEIMEIVVPFLDAWDKMKQVNYVIPAPSSKAREVQPVYLLADRIAEYLNVGWSSDILQKISTDELKGASVAEKRQRIEGSIIKRKKAKAEHTMLLVDDCLTVGLR